MLYISKNITGDEVSFYQQIIPHMNIIFDVGTMKDTIFYDMNPIAEIHMFDPVPDYINVLKDKMKGKKHSMIFNNVGLGSKTETKDLHYRYGSIIKRDIPRFKDMHESYEVNIIRLDDYCKDKGVTEIDYLKIDTEGYDFEVIKGCGNMLDKIRFIQFEDFKIFYGGETKEDIFDYFEGWNIYLIGGRPKNYLATKETVNLKKIR